jgi:hypothetical protein
MNKSGILSPFWEKPSKEEKLIDFYPTPSDSTHFIVSRFLVEGMERIGHVYVEIEEDGFRYISTNRQGKQIFPPTTDFNLVEINFERYARFLALQKLRKNHKRSKVLNHNINFKNTNTMKTETQNTAQKNQKQNQLTYLEYEKPTGNGHFITVGDSYHNVIGRIHKSFNEETKKYEYVAFDHAGNLMSKSDKLWEVKNEFIKNRETLLEQAHQRRIASKEKFREVSEEKSEKVQQVNRIDQRKNEIGKLREGTIGKEVQTEKSKEQIDSRSLQENNDRPDSKQNQQDEREQELNEIRNSRDDDRGDNELDR